MKKTIIFLHIPKTAGTSFGRILRENCFLWPKNKVYWQEIKKYSKKPIEKMSLKERHNLKVIRGHIYYGTHELLDQNFTYISFLRDPVKRIISYYYYILVMPNHYLYDQVQGKNMSLKEFLSSGLTRELDNLQVRTIYGPEEAIPYGKVDSSHLDVAKQNIENFFPVVGLTEYFDESILLMRDHVWKFFPFYVRANVNSSLRKQRKVLDEETLTLIKENNKYDLLLYDWARERLMRQMEEVGERFQTRVELYRVMNGIFRTVMKLFPVYKK